LLWLLRFLVGETTAGRNKSLKERVVAVEVFGRQPGFDPKLDPVVRNEMRRLRAKLLEYYAGHTNRAGLVLEIPKGVYAPTLRKVSVSDGNRSSVRRYTVFVGAALLQASGCDLTHQILGAGSAGRLRR